MKITMSSSIKTIEQIIVELPEMHTYIHDSEHYYAHVSNFKAPEILMDHTKLVVEKFGLLCNEHDLDDTINRMILDIVKSNFETENIKIAAEFIKLAFVNIAVFHDFGKVNDNFQAHPDKMNNKYFNKIDSPISSRHSALSSYLYIIFHFQTFSMNKAFCSKEHVPLLCIILGLSYSILKHHSKFLNDKIEDGIDYSKSEIEFMQNYIQKFIFEIKEPFRYEIPTKLKDILFKKLPLIKLSFALYSLIKLNYSLLTASDYLATNEYMNGFDVNDVGILNRKRINDIYSSATSIKVYNKSTYKSIKGYVFRKPTSISNDNLNILRQEMAIETINNIQKNNDNNLFYIEAPTGGGKTNLSILAVAELLKHDNKLNKVFYVFPFTSLITQTHESITETLGLKQNEIIKLHSKSGFQFNDNGEDDLYGNKKKNYIDNLFVNYPFCLLTHIKFFDLMKSNEKGANYLLHRLSNSIVVLDELQSYNPSHWDKIIYFIKKYAYYFNIKFILMSATLPKLDKLNVIRGEVNDFVYLLENPKDDYFRNPNFANRIEFNFDLLDKNELALQELADFLFQKARKYSDFDFGLAKPKGSVYVIIEFIFKKSATEFAEIINNMNDFFDKVFVLSGTILEHRRQYIINYLKNTENRKQKILLITTQVVEAGVDIDMDLGFKNKSLIDSDEQLAGRINRNVNKKKCKLYLFQINEPSLLYKNDKRYKVTKEMLTLNEYKDILKEKKFDQLYSLVFENIDEWNQTQFAVNFSEYVNHIRNLKFKSVSDEFKLIDQDNYSIFVPIPIPCKIIGVANIEETLIFSEDELCYLEKAQILPDDNNEIDGEQVFDLYISLIHNKKTDFIDQKIDMKILSGIMSKFTFSNFLNNNDMSKLLAYSDEDKLKYGIIYLNAHDYIYNIKTGLNLDNNDSVII